LIFNSLDGSLFNPIDITDGNRVFFSNLFGLGPEFWGHKVGFFEFLLS